jgi:hypothetical protein
VASAARGAQLLVIDVFRQVTGTIMANDDKFTSAYAVKLTLAILLISFTSVANDIYDSSGGFFVFMALLLTAIILIFSLLQSIWHLKWRQVASIGFAVFVLYSVPPLLGRFGVPVTSESMRFAVIKSWYLAEIAKSSQASGEPRLKAFPWRASYGLGGGVAVVTTLIYDESDEIALPLEQQSASWMKRYNVPCEECSSLRTAICDTCHDSSRTVRKIGPHFYLESLVGP